MRDPCPHLGRARNGRIRPCPQYQRPRAKPPKASKPISATITPIKTLQKIAITIPAITMAPPKVRPTPNLPSYRMRRLIPASSHSRNIRALVPFGCTCPGAEAGLRAERRAASVRSVCAHRKSGANRPHKRCEPPILDRSRLTGSAFPCVATVASSCRCESFSGPVNWNTCVSAGSTRH